MKMQKGKQVGIITSLAGAYIGLLDGKEHKSRLVLNKQGLLGELSGVLSCFEFAYFVIDGIQLLFNHVFHKLHSGDRVEGVFAVQLYFFHCKFRCVTGEVEKNVLPVSIF